ncbi:MAG: glutaconate CoA-transferase [Enterovirga sp.]|nr:glutaconate CoA-transferase [Enterovirga sp.]
MTPSAGGRHSKLIGAAEIGPTLLRFGRDGCSVCLGGLFKQGRPVALVRELIRTGLSDLRLFSSPGSGYDVDLLIAAGRVAETFLPAVTLENRFCPSFRGAVERGEITAHAIDALTVVGGLMAAAHGVPFQPVAAWAGSDVTSLNPLARPIASPFGDEPLYAVPAIRPDLVLLHAQEGDEYGNLRNLSTMTYADALMARAGQHVVASVDKLVPNEAILRDPRGTTVAGIYVDAVVEIPFGAHPTASFPHYSMDESFIERFADLAEAGRRAGSTAEVTAYLERFVLGPADIFDYLEALGGYRALAPLEREARFL